MLFRFKTSKLSDSLKLAEFLEKSGIQFEIAMDITVGVDGTAVSEAQKEEAVPTATTSEVKPNALGITPITGRDPDPLWRPAIHDNQKCTDKEGCKHVKHYGAEDL